uniref:60S ribosomal export protein NMD3 n=1 Tax=Oryza glumipatula TaxID=40148 RepID=A0A0E0B890_9ORYZ
MARVRAQALAEPPNQCGWFAVVQVWQRASHRRTLLHLEQQVVTHGTAVDTLRVGTAHGVGGLDFFVSRSHSARLIDLVTLLSPTRVVASKQLVSHDSNNSSYDVRHTFTVELCPVCRDRE